MGLRKKAHFFWSLLSLKQILLALYTYLALGDSYTIGESVSIYQSFPYQLVQLLRAKNLAFQAPEIVAQTGWTTDELLKHIENTLLLPPYNLVTLLIGVNNQYRERSVNEYAMQFSQLIDHAIHFAGNNPERVVVLSIPDWGATPFAADRNRELIRRQIDEYNEVNLQLTRKRSAHYIDITEGTRKAIYDRTIVTRDDLHYSGKEHARWAAAVLQTILYLFDETETER